MATQKGFTLIELMVTVAIIGIIAAIAFPSYQRSVENTRRAAAEADLLELVQFMERRYSRTFDYRDGGGAPPLPFSTSPRGHTAGEAFYTLGFQGAVAQSTYVLQAVPVNAHAGDPCGTLTIDDQGLTSSTGSGPRCW